MKNSLLVCRPIFYVNDSVCQGYTQFESFSFFFTFFYNIFYVGYRHAEVQCSFHGSHYIWWQWLQSVALGFTMLYWELGRESSQRLKIGQSTKVWKQQLGFTYTHCCSDLSKLHLFLSHAQSRNVDRQLSHITGNKRFCYLLSSWILIPAE